MRHLRSALMPCRRISSLLLGFSATALPAAARAQASDAASSTMPAAPATSPAEGDPTSMTLGELDTVTVEAERQPFDSRDVIGSVTIVGASQIANESVNEPLDLLRKLPGVFTEQFNQGIPDAHQSGGRVDAARVDRDRPVTGPC